MCERKRKVGVKKEEVRFMSTLYRRFGARSEIQIGRYKSKEVRSQKCALQLQHLWPLLRAHWIRLREEQSHERDAASVPNAAKDVSP